MKKITFLLLSLFALGANAQQTLTQSTSMTVGNTNVACNAGTAPNTTSSANEYLRFFNLSGAGITQTYQINNVQFGISSLRTPTLPAGFPLTVNIYSTTSATFAPATFPASFSLEASETVLVQVASVGTNIIVPISATIPVGTNILVGLSYETQTAGSLNQIFLSANDLGQSAPNYIVAAGCSITTPSTMASIGFPTAHLALTINAQNLSVKDNALKTLAVYPNPAKDVLNFNLPQNVELQKVNLADITGKQVELTVSNNTVDIARFAPGVYMLSIQTNEGNITRKVVKN